MSYNAEPMACAAKVMEAVPQLSAQLLAHLATLAVTNTTDKDMVALIPSPLNDFPQHRLAQTHKMLLDGELWHCREEYRYDEMFHPVIISKLRPSSALRQAIASRIS